MPTPFTVTYTPRVRAGENAQGQPTYEDGTPSDRKVVTWYPTNESERNEAAMAERTISEMTLLSADDNWGAADKVALDGVDYEVIGNAKDFTNNPFARNFGGYEINLKRVNDG